MTTHASVLNSKAPTRTVRTAGGTGPPPGDPSAVIPTGVEGSLLLGVELFTVIRWPPPLPEVLRPLL